MRILVSGSRVSVNGMIEMVGELLGRRLKVKYLPVVLGDVQDTSADTWTARKLLGFTPTVQLRDGLAAEVQWIQEQFHGEASGLKLGGSGLYAD